MLAAILLNLSDYQNTGDASPPKKYISPNQIKRQKNIHEEVAKLSKLLDNVTTLEPLKQIEPKIKAYSENKLPIHGLSELIRELSMREFELKRDIQHHDPHSVLILEHITIILTIMRDDEDAIIALLLG